ncbi:MAG: hypothetical protein ACYCPP_08610 [Nitrososphaerales archaeon]
MSKAGQQVRTRSEEPSWLIAAIFSGLGAGFIAFWVTLSPVYAEGICAIGAILVWPLAGKVGGPGFANRATIIYLVATAIGVGVGFASSIGTGVPVTGI